MGKKLTFILLFALLSLCNINGQTLDLGNEHHPKLGGTLDFYQNGKVVSLRRARLSIKGNLSDFVSYKFQGEFVNPKLVDGIIGLHFAPYCNVYIGQLSVPISIESEISSSQLEALTNAQVISRLCGHDDIVGINYSGRDVGIMVSGEAINYKRGETSFPILSYDIGVFNGNGSLSDNNSSKDFVARIGFTPFIKDLTLSSSIYLGTYSYINDRTFDVTRNRFAVGAKYEGDKFHFRSEFLMGETGVLNSLNTATHNIVSNGWYFTAGYWFDLQKVNDPIWQNRIQPIMRYEQYNEDITNPDTKAINYLFGLEWQPTNFVKFRLNYAMQTISGVDKTKRIISSQLTAYF